MYQILRATTVEYGNKGGLKQVEIACDSSSDLPQEIPKDWCMGSIAWDISTGDFYGLKSDGTWANQSGSDSDSDAKSISLSKSISSPLPEITEENIGQEKEYIPEDEEPQEELKEEVKIDADEPLRDTQER